MPKNLDRKQKDPNFVDKKKNQPKVIPKKDPEKQTTTGSGGNEPLLELPGNLQNEQNLPNVSDSRIDSLDIIDNEIDPIVNRQERKKPPNIDKPIKQIPDKPRIKDDPFIDKKPLGPRQKPPIDKPQTEKKPVEPGVPGEDAPSSFTISLLRPRDLLLLDFTFINFDIKPAIKTIPVTLNRKENAPFSYIIVEFPQQSILEEAFFEADDNFDYQAPPGQVEPDGDDDLPEDQPAQTRISGKSRLVFKPPANADPIPYTIEGLLGVMSKYPLVVAVTAKPPDLSNESPNWTFNPQMVMQTAIRYGFTEREGLSSVKKRALLKTNNKKLISEKRTLAGKESQVEGQYSLTEKAIRQTYENYRTERSKLVSTLESVNSALIEAGNVDVIELVKPELLPPTEYETSIEAPFRLILSPNRYAAWVHTTKEVVATRKILYGIYPTGQKVTKSIGVDNISATEEKSLSDKKVKPLSRKRTKVKQPVEKAELRQLLDSANLVSKSPITINNVHILYENIDWVELWHTRLGTSLNNIIVESINPLQTVRAIWAKDAKFSPIIDGNYPRSFGDEENPCPDNLFRASLDAFDRFNIVHLSSNYRLKDKDTNSDYKPTAIPVDRMMLSGLGSWLNLRGVWNPLPEFLQVEEWRHRSTMARDHFVRVVYQGYLFPFGHKASLIKVTERKFHNSLEGNPAYLRQRMFIVVREPERIYPQTNIKQEGKQYDLAFPFTRVQIITLVTPLLNKPENSAIAGHGQQLFRPCVGTPGKDFKFQVVAEDLEGREVEFSLPMIFIGKTIMDGSNSTVQNWLKAAQWDYTGIGTADFSWINLKKNEPADPAVLDSQAVCFAASQQGGDTTLPTQFIWFGAQIASLANYNQLKNIYSSGTARFYPRIEKASARIPAIQNLVGINESVKFKYLDDYLISGFGTNNRGEIYLELMDKVLPLNFSNQGQRSGALLTPNLNIAGLSRKYGPVGGQKGKLDDITQDVFDPEAYFAGMVPMLFGVIKLTDLIDLSTAGSPPTFITKTMTPIQGLLLKLQNLRNQLETLGELIDENKKAIEDLIALLDTILNCLAQILIKVSISESIDSFVSDLLVELSNVDQKIEDVLVALRSPKVPASVRIPLEDALVNLRITLNDFQSSLAEIQEKLEYFNKLNQLITEQKITLDWSHPLNNWPTGDPIFEGTDDEPNPKAKLKLHAEMDGKSSQKGTAALTTTCGLYKFNLNLIGKNTAASFMILKFDKVEFVYASGSKADVNVEFAGIEFVGVLSFVELLRTLIPLDGFSDPPGLDISANGITASYSLALPNLALGVFSLTNMSLAAGFSIPFIGDPLSVWFGFCTRENPFTLTVSMFGGGGFFAITLQPDGLQCLEAAFEFGASISVDFGVASGGVHAMAGIYFKMEKDAKNNYLASLTGYFRMGGYISVLGLVSVSIELYLALTYETPGKCVGVAELTLEVKVIFFSVCVKARVERKFSGSNGDPTFAELMEAFEHPVDGSLVDPWEKYCEAFA